MRSTIALAILVAACCTPPQPAPQQQGALGHPLGSWLHIEGTRATDGKVGPHDFVVERVDGATLAQPVPIHLDNLGVPAGERCALAGYESGRWFGTPPEVAAGEGLMPTQAAWQFVHVFVVTSVQAPEQLVLAARAAGIGRD